MASRYQPCFAVGQEMGNRQAFLFLKKVCLGHGGDDLSPFPLTPMSQCAESSETDLMSNVLDISCQDHSLTPVSQITLL